MPADVVATVVALWRYPVKSMMGEQLNAGELTDRGLLGDRAYALVDRETGKVASAKFPRKWPTLLAHRATYVEPPVGADGLPAVRITLPDGRIIRSDDPAETSPSTAPRQRRRASRSTGPTWKASITGTR